jgi:hypothetical protein
MKPQLSLFALALCWLLSACDLEVEEPEVVSLEGREPQVVTWVSGHQWFPSTIALLVEQEEGRVYLEASSSENRGYRRRMRLSISDEQLNWPPADTLDLLNTQLPARVFVEYEQFRDRLNQNSSRWLGETNEQGGLRITAIEAEEGIVYAAGNFFMSPYLFIDRPNTQQIEGLFNNVRVFTHPDSLQAYFARVAAWEAARAN